MHDGRRERGGKEGGREDSVIVRPGSNVSTIHGEFTEMLIQCTEKTNGGIK